MSANPAQNTARERFAASAILSDDIVAARVDGEVYDLHTVLPTTATTVDPIRLADPDALAIIRHSSAHVMADAVQRLFPGTKVAFGPAVDNGFYYDYRRPNGESFSEDDLRRIEEKMGEIIAADFPFRREDVTKEAARAELERLEEPFKLEHLERLEGQISLYRHGNWVDLCEGPHVPSTRYLQAFKLTHVSGAYWRGDERNPMLQRIYGTAFPSREALDAYLKQLEEAKQRDHRKLGKELGLVGFHPLAPASPFFLPRGTAVYNRLVDYVRSLYRETGYDEVITPQIFESSLWQTSGHLPAYYENMFMAATVENFERASAQLVKEPPKDVDSCSHMLHDSMRFAVKPMNCPSHCLIFGMHKHSYRDLPVRMADFGRLHRFERSGVTQGLTRVRTFCQDDAHIFCTIDQMQSEIAAFIDLVYRVYSDFAFTDVRVVIATRPEQRLGSDDVWDKSEAALIDAVKTKGIRFEIADGEGAFYGPKIEFHLKDAIGRSWQLGTIQVDYNMPERFELEYVGEDNTTHRPVMLHRAILGSIERFFGVLLEHVAGAFPTWLAPDQITLLTVSEKFNGYAEEVVAEFKAAGIRATANLSGDKLGAKIREARMSRVPYLAVVGGKEVEARGLGVRSRDENAELGLLPLADVKARLLAESLPPSARR